MKPLFNTKGKLASKNTEGNQINNNQLQYWTKNSNKVKKLNKAGQDQKISISAFG